MGACAELAAERGVEVALERPSHPVRLGVEAELAERILQPILENACRYGRRHVSISIARAHGGAVYTIDDDGPGVADDERERIFEPGVRGRLAVNGTGSAGLGLGLARRLARSTAGDVEAIANGGGGRFLVQLPVA